MRSPAAAFDLRAALTEELQAAVEELEASPSQPKAVHRCRVRVKRARALARIGRAGAPGLAGVFNDTARGVMRTLAQGRDVVALAEAARAFAKKEGKKTAAALVAVADALEEERLRAPGLNMEGARAGLKDLLALALVWPEASPRQIRRGADRIARRARRARRRGFEAKAAAPRHEWRKREKDRYFAALLLGEAWPRARRRKLGEKLGDMLGHERDARLLLDRLVAEPDLAGEGKAPARALKALAARCRKFSDKADALGQELHAAGA